MYQEGGAFEVQLKQPIRIDEFTRESLKHINPYGTSHLDLSTRILSMIVGQKRPMLLSPSV